MLKLCDKYGPEVLSLRNKNMAAETSFGKVQTNIAA